MPTTFTEPITTPAAARAPRPPSGPLITLTTDFGLRDPSASICHGVILQIAPDARVVDISHEVAKFEIVDGALLLWCALTHMPVGTHVAVVDPGVGTDRLAIALEARRGDVLVGPDNGLLLPAAERLGGVTRVHALENRAYRLPVVSSSFHGRDIFAPAAAHLALGVPLDELGPALDPAALVRLDWPEPRVGPGHLEAAVIYVDTFGNVKLAAEVPDLPAALGPLEPGTPLHLSIAGDGGPVRTTALAWVPSFGHVPAGAPLVYPDSYGRLCVAVNRGSAADALALGRGMRVELTRAG